MEQLRILYFFTFVLILSANNVHAQIKEGSIKYKVDLLDEFSGRPIDDRLGTIDWQFQVDFSKNKSRVFQQYLKNKSTSYIHNKETGIVLSLHQEFDAKFIDYFSSQGSSVKQLGHSYGDTVRTEYDETKKILGYNCRKIELDLGGQVKGIFWVTDEIEIGTLLAGSALALKHPALEYTFEGAGTKEHYLASEIKTTISDSNIFNEEIPSDYKLIVPIGVYDQEEFIEDSSKIDHLDFDFISYPKYPEGLTSLYDLFNNLPAYSAVIDDFMEGEDEEPVYFGPNSVLAHFTVDLSGKISDISVRLAPNAAIENAVIDILGNMKNWLPATVKNVPIVAEMNLSITFPILIPKE